MKKLLIMTVAIAFIAIFNSCGNDGGDDIIYDFAPLTVDFRIENASGVNLLDPTSEGSLFDKEITLECNGTTYDVQWVSRNDIISQGYKTRYYMPMFTGLTYEQPYEWEGDKYIYYPEKAYLSFGEFDATEDHDMDIKIRIEGCSKTFNLTVKHKFYPKKHRSSTTYRLDGTKVENKFALIIP